MRLLTGILAGLFGCCCLPAQQTTVTLASTNYSPLFGQSFTLTATVAPAPSSGKVTFYDGVTVLGAGVLTAGQASLKTSLLSGGAHFVTAWYAGVTSGLVPIAVFPVAANTFRAGPTYPVHGFLNIGDFNGDGKPDLVVATNTTPGVVSVQLGNGDGTFGPPATFPTHAYPTEMAVADFNNDGKLDLAVQSDQFINVLFGNGDGTFQPPVITNVSIGAPGLKAADFNGDGIVDLAFVSGTGTDITILLGNNNGTFQFPRSYPSGAKVLWVAVGDFNGDGKADVVAANYTDNPGTITVLLNNGDGTMRAAGAYAVGQTPNFIAVADFNGDGKADLACTNYLDGSVSVLLGNGSGAFAPAVNYFTGVVGGSEIVVADVDGDGKPDLAVGTAGVTKVFFGNGDGTFRPASAWSLPLVVSMAADFNGDGRVDLASAFGSAVAIFLGAVTTSTTTTLVSSPNPSIYGQNVTLTASVSPAGFVGTVTIYDGLTLLSAKPLVNGQASISTTILAPGVHSFSASYSGDPSSGYSYSPLLPQTVNRAPSSSTTVLASSASLVSLGQSVTLTATVTPAQASGKVTFYDGTAILGSASVAGGQAVLTTPLLPFGTRRLSAAYSGDAGFAPSASAISQVTVRSVPSDGYQTVNLGSGTFNSPVTADFNNDGKQDIAVTTGSSVRVYLGIGDGSFQSPKNSPAVNVSTAMTAGDFNRDGIADLAIANNNNGGIAVLIGNGDGTFQPPVSYAVNPFPTAILMADFNQDGKPDLVVSGYRQTLLLGNGDGTFQAGVDFGFGIFTVSAATGDFNGDGKPDLVITGSEDRDNLFILLGNGDGTFQPPLRSSVPNVNSGGVAVGDFNGDGKADLVVSGIFTGIGTTILMGRGDGTFQQGATYGPGDGALSIVLGDFNGDGKMDFVVPNHSSQIALFAGNGDGTFSVTPDYRTSAFSSVAIGDFNGDGRTDVVIAGGGLIVTLGTQQTPSMVALISSMNPSVAGQSVTLTATVSANGFPANSGSVTFYDGASILGNRPVVSGQASLSSNVLPAGTHSLKVHFAGAGIYSDSNSTVLLQAVNPVPAAGLTTLGYNNGGNNRMVAVSDLNRDGKADLVIAAGASHFVSILLGNGDGTFRTPVKITTPGDTNWVAVADFDGDGISDLVVDYYGDALFYPGNGDGTFRDSSYISLHFFYSATTIGDFNGDGKADLASGDRVNSGIVVLGNGNGTFGPVAGYATGLTAIYALPGDFDADGKSDLAVVNLGGNTISVLLGKGDGTFQTARTFAAGFQPVAVASADFNGDGRPDLVVSNFGGVSVLLGNGDGTFQQAVSYVAGDQPTGVATADFNGDGKADIAETNNEGTLSVLQGNGNGTFQAAVNYPAGAQLSSVAIGDFNGDGRPDAVTVGQTGSINILLGKVPLAGARMPATRAGVFRNGVSFLEDSNGNAAYDAGTDRFIPGFTGANGFAVGDLPVVGDWTGDGTTKVGIYRTSTGTWFLDANNNGVFDAGDLQYQFGGLAGDLPFAGDWTGTGKSCIGIYRSNGSVWLLDLNCNGAYDNIPVDAFFPFGGIAGDVPVVGSWTGAATRVGVVRKYAPLGVPQGDPFYWVLDGGAANAGSAAANHQPDLSRCFAFGGLPGDVFVTGDWYNTGISAAGVYRNGFWVLDAALPNAPQSAHVTGMTFGYGGILGDIPLTGKW